MSGQLYERRAQLESRAPLTLVTTLEIDDIPTVELTMHYEDGSKRKVKVPTHDMESLEQVFYCFHEFLEAARKLQLDGGEWFDYYRDTLRGHARTAWDLIATVVPNADRNEDQFRTAFRTFVSTIVDETAHRLLMEYLRSTVKPRNMSVMEVARRVQVLCGYADDLPTESGQLPVSITEDEKKTLFYNMMPENWKTTFTKGNMRIATMNIAQMTIYFNGLCALEGGNKQNKSGKKRKNDDDNSSRSNRQRSGGYGRSGGNRNNRYYERNNGYDSDRGGRGRGVRSSGRGVRSSGRGGRGRGRGRGGRGGQTNRVHNNDICPVHGGHKWRECFLNPYGDDYRPRTGNDRNQNSQGRGNGSRRGDAYHSTNSGGNGGQGNGAGNNNNERTTSGGDRSEGRNDSSNNEHYLAEIGTPEWN